MAKIEPAGFVNIFYTDGESVVEPSPGSVVPHWSRQGRSNSLPLCSSGSGLGIICLNVAGGQLFRPTINIQTWGILPTTSDSFTNTGQGITVECSAVLCLFLVTSKGASLKLHDKIFTWITMQVTPLIMLEITKISSRSLLN